MDIKDFQLVPYTQRHYAPSDPDDPNTPFVEAISLDIIEEEEEEGLEIRTYNNGRVQKINLHNITFADAILNGALSAKKKDGVE